MASFELETVDEHGKTITVVIDADSIDEVEAGARAAGLKPVRVTPIDTPAVEDQLRDAATRESVQQSVQDRDPTPIDDPASMRDTALTKGRARALIEADTWHETEPFGTMPPDPPRSIPAGALRTGSTLFKMLFGGFFMAIASIFIIVGIGMLISGTIQGLFFVLFPMIHFVIGAVVATSGLRTRNRRKNLIIEGDVAVGTITSIGRERKVKINGRHPYKITYAFEHGGTPYNGKHSTMNEELRRYGEKDRLWVLFEPSDPSNNMEWPPV